MYNSRLLFSKRKLSLREDYFKQRNLFKRFAYRSDVGKDQYDYYYRPRKNVINRPTSQGGTGLYIYGLHEKTIPSMYHHLKDRV